MTLDEVANKTKNNPLSIHTNPLGLFGLGGNNIDEIFEKFNFILNQIENKGGNVAIPTYSYTYTKNETFDILNTPSDLGPVSEYIRVKNLYKRTSDANYSYVLFGKLFSASHYELNDYSSFGDNSLIEELLVKDGYLGSVGNVLEYLTEIHYVENKLGVAYRFNKEFSGKTIDIKGNESVLKMEYFCRNYDIEKNVTLLTTLIRELKENNLIELWHIEEFNIEIEVIKFRIFYNFIQDKLSINGSYLL